MIEQITDNDLIIAIIIRAQFKKEGVEFFTPNNFSQQLGYMNRSKGYIIEAHAHKKPEQNVHLTYEVLYIKSGKIKICLYNNNLSFLQECILNTGDVILLASGGHSIEMIEDTEIIEIRQGPYNGNDDKINFIPIKL